MAPRDGYDATLSGPGALVANLWLVVQTVHV